MSVINQMLQDLESRRGNADAEDSHTTHVRAVPSRSHAAGWAVLLLGLAMTTVGLLWLLRPDGHVEPLHPSAIVGARLSPGSRQASSETPKMLLAAVTAPVVILPPSPVPSLATVTATAFRLKPSLSLGLRASAAPSTTGGKELTVPRPKIDVPATTQAPAVAIPEKTVPELRSTAALGAPIKEITQKQRADNAYAAALTMLQEDRSAEAADLLGTVLQQDPGNSSARETLVSVLVAAKRYGDAQRQLQEGLKLHPAQSGQAMLLARLQVEQGDVAAALATLQRSLPAGGDRADYHGFMAALLQREGRHRDAIEHYQRALRKAPASGVWLTGLGISLQAENRLSEAQEAFERARSSNSLNPELKSFVEQQLQR